MSEVSLFILIRMTAQILDRQGAEFDEDGAPHQKMVLRMPL
jgi:hypothetical protein